MTIAPGQTIIVAVLGLVVYMEVTPTPKVPHKNVVIATKVPHKSVAVCAKVPHKSVVMRSKVPHKSASSPQTILSLFMILTALVLFTSPRLFYIKNGK